MYENGKIYFHCSKEVGHKLKNISYQKKCCFTVVNKADVKPAEFSTDYESVIAFGEIYAIKEKNAILYKIIEKYSPDYIDEGRKYISGMSNATMIYCIEIIDITGKARRK